MAALRCSFCGYNYPTSLSIRVCPVCDQEVSFFSNVDPSPDWEEIVKAAKKDAPPNSVAIMMLDEPYPPWLFVSHDDLLEQGYTNLEDFLVVSINGTKYELQGYLKDANCWWVEEVVEADEVDRLRSDLESWHGPETPT